VNRDRQLPRWIVTVALGALGAAGVACAHAKEVGAPDQGPAAAGESVSHGTPPADRTAPLAHAPTPAHPHASPPRDGAGDAADTTIATSPGGLLVPGAAHRIQEKLAARGLLDGTSPSGELDGPTRQALRRFQHDSDLPATGVPDDETVRKLGLAPESVFKRGVPQPKPANSI
jgi:Putative peptidoglycan binding domain